MIKGKNVRRLHFIMIIIYHYDKIGRVGEFDNKKFPRIKILFPISFSHFEILFLEILLD